MRVLIHIGPQKTGTTYMQSRLFHVRHRLARHGIAYHLPPQGKLPPHLMPQDGSDESLAALGRLVQASDVSTLLAQRNIDRFAADVAAIRAQGFACLVISNEALARLRPDLLTPLAEIFAGDEVEIYAYCRRWSERLPSQWWQQVSTGLTTPFPQWWHNVVVRGEKTWVVNESLLWSRWAALFGRSAINLVSYDALRAENADIAEDFLFQRLQWKGIFRIEPRRRERRKMPSPIEIEVIRSLNAAAETIGVQITASLRRALLERLREADYQPFRDIAGDAAQTMDIDDAGPSFAAATAAMRAWEDRLVTRNVSPQIVLPRQTRYQFVPPEPLQAPAAQAAFGDLLASAGARA